MFTVQPEAAVTMLLHVCRHSQAAVFGVLLGPASSSSGGTAEDCLPLFHSQAVLGPLLPAALTQVLRLSKLVPQVSFVTLPDSHTRPLRCARAQHDPSNVTIKMCMHAAHAVTASTRRLHPLQ